MISWGNRWSVCSPCGGCELFSFLKTEDHFAFLVEIQVIPGFQFKILRIGINHPQLRLLILQLVAQGIPMGGDPAAFLI